MPLQNLPKHVASNCGCQDREDRKEDFRIGGHPLRICLWLVQVRADRMVDFSIKKR